MPQEVSSEEQIIQAKLDKLEDCLRVARNLCNELKMPKIRERIDITLSLVPADLAEYQEEVNA